MSRYFDNNQTNLGRFPSSKQFISKNSSSNSSSSFVGQRHESGELDSLLDELLGVRRVSQKYHIFSNHKTLLPTKSTPYYNESQQKVGYATKPKNSTTQRQQQTQRYELSEREVELLKELCAAQDKLRLLQSKHSDYSNDGSSQLGRMNESKQKAVCTVDIKRNRENMMNLRCNEDYQQNVAHKSREKRYHSETRMASSTQDGQNKNTYRMDFYDNKLAELENLLKSEQNKINSFSSQQADVTVHEVVNKEELGDEYEEVETITLQPIGKGILDLRTNSQFMPSLNERHSNLAHRRQKMTSSTPHLPSISINNEYRANNFREATLRASTPQPISTNRRRNSSSMSQTQNDKNNEIEQKRSTEEWFTSPKPVKNDETRLNEYKSKNAFCMKDENRISQPDIVGENIKDQTSLIAQRDMLQHNPRYVRSTNQEQDHHMSSHQFTNQQRHGYEISKGGDSFRFLNQQHDRHMTNTGGNSLNYTSQQRDCHDVNTGGDSFRFPNQQQDRHVTNTGGNSLKYTSQQRDCHDLNTGGDSFRFPNQQKDHHLLNTGRDSHQFTNQQRDPQEMNAGGDSIRFNNQYKDHQGRKTSGDIMQFQNQSFGVGDEQSGKSNFSENGAKASASSMVQDCIHMWYKPNIGRDDVINNLRNKPPGSFIIRNSHSYPGSYGLAIRVAYLPAGVQPKSTGSTDPKSDLVRHFLIEATSNGFKLKGCADEPFFTSLAALVYHHTMTPLALPCCLNLPEMRQHRSSYSSHPEPKSSHFSDIPSQQVIHHGEQLNETVCNVIFLGSVQVESFNGSKAIDEAIQMLLANPQSDSLHAIKCQIKLAENGITFVDVERKLFFRRHYPLNAISYCALDPRSRSLHTPEMKANGISNSLIFGIIVQRWPTNSDNVCHLMCELSCYEPVESIVQIIQNYLSSHR